MPTRHAKFSDLVLAESCLMFARLLSTSLLVFSCSAVLATEYRVGELQIDTPWSRALPPNAPAGAVYFTVKNGGRMADRLTGADTPNAAKTELHTHLRTGEVMRMQHIDSIEVPAGAEVKLTPGGHHIMIFKPKRPLAAGERFPPDPGVREGRQGRDRGRSPQRCSRQRRARAPLTQAARRPVTGPRGCAW